MAIGYLNFCLLCRDPMGLNVQDVAEHLESKHLLTTSAGVLAANMFANRNAYEEVWIILREFEAKSAELENAERKKTAALHILSNKDEEIKLLVDEVKEAKSELKYETSRLRQRIESERMTHNKVIEDQQEEMLDLKVKESSLTNEMETLRRHASSMSMDLKVLENKCEGVSEREAENVQLKDLVKAQESKLKSVAVNIENIRICSLTTELFEAKEDMKRLKKELEFMTTNCENLKSLLTSQNLEKMKSGKIVADLNKEIMKLKMAFKKKDFNINHPNQIKWEGLVKEKIKEIKDMSKVFDEEKICLEGALEKKEHIIGKLR